MIADRVAPFDFVFIDADKQRSDAYFARRARALACRHGDRRRQRRARRQGRRRRDHRRRREGHPAHDRLIAAEPRLSATAIQTVGGKGYDGFVVAVVVAAPAGWTVDDRAPRRGDDVAAASFTIRSARDSDVARCHASSPARLRRSPVDALVGAWRPSMQPGEEAIVAEDPCCARSLLAVATLHATPVLHRAGPVGRVSRAGRGFDVRGREVSAAR